MCHARNSVCIRLNKMQLASIMNLHQFIFKGEDKMEFNSVVNRPDHMSQAPLGTWWRVKTRREIKRREGRLTKDSEWRPSPGCWFDKEETGSGLAEGHVAVRVAVLDGAWTWLERTLKGTWVLIGMLWHLPDQLGWQEVQVVFDLAQEQRRHLAFKLFHWEHGFNLLIHRNCWLEAYFLNKLPKVIYQCHFMIKGQCWQFIFVIHFCFDYLHFQTLDEDLPCF